MENWSIIILEKGYFSFSNKRKKKRIGNRWREKKRKEKIYHSGELKPQGQSRHVLMCALQSRMTLYAVRMCSAIPRNNLKELRAVKKKKKLSKERPSSVLKAFFLLTEDKIKSLKSISQHTKNNRRNFMIFGAAFRLNLGLYNRRT